jgi:hypothetical protein
VFSYQTNNTVPRCYVDLDPILIQCVIQFLVAIDCGTYIKQYIRIRLIIIQLGLPVDRVLTNDDSVYSYLIFLKVTRCIV